MNKAIVFILAFLMSSLVFSQEKFKTHAVKEGETIESIAKMYRVSSAEILKLNPEVKRGIKPNTILIIPVSGQDAGQFNPDKNREPQRENNVVIREPEIKFITHKVRKKETLYSVSKQYNVTPEDLKRYNRELYSRQLKRNERIRIPVYVQRVVIDTLDQGAVSRKDLVPYVVKPKEGKWRIAYEHGISVEELDELNPGIGEVLQEGQQLMVPRLDSIALKTVDDLNYNYYTVLPKEGFYRLKVKLGVSQEEVEMLNPEVRDSGLQAGMILKLPKDKTGEFDVKDGKLVPQISLLDSIKRSSVSNISFVIPFKLNEFDYDSINKVKQRLSKDRLVSVSVDFYTGALMALDSARQLGLSVNARVFDSEGNDVAVARVLANHREIETSQAVIGPILAKPFNRLAMELRNSNVPVFAPMANKGISLYTNVFQTLPSDEMVAEKMMGYIERHAAGKNIVIIADKNNAASKAELLRRIPYAKILEPKDDSYLSLDELTRIIKDSTENWVIVESNSIPLLTNITNLLNSQISATRKIVMLTTRKGSAYDVSDDIKNSYLSRLNFHYPTVDRPSPSNESFQKKYEKRFGTLPNRYAVRGFDLTMDIVLRLAYNPNMYEVADKLSETEYIENKFDYIRNPTGGYYNKGIYLVKFDNMEIKEIKDDF